MIGRRFDFDGFALELRAPDESHFEWLSGYYSYPLAAETQTPAASVELVSSPLEHAQGQEDAEQAPLRPGFTFDNRESQIPRWCKNGIEKAFDRDLGILIERQETSIRIIGGSDPGAARVAWMRVVRELHERWLAGRGFALIHAAAVALPGSRHIVLISGPRKSGKSTLLTFLTAHGRASYVTNDRLAVHEDGRAIAIPTVVSIRPGTLEHLPGLPPVPHEYRLRYPHRRSQRELESALGESPSARENPFSGTPAQYRDWLSASNVSSGSVIAVIFPQVGALDAPDLVPLDGSRLEEQRIRAPRDGLFADLFTAPKESFRLAAPAYRCRLGSYPTEAASDLLGRLAGTLSHPKHASGKQR